MYTRTDVDRQSTKRKGRCDLDYMTCHTMLFTSVAYSLCVQVRLTVFVYKCGLQSLCTSEAYSLCVQVWLTVFVYKCGLQSLCTSKAYSLRSCVNLYVSFQK